MKDSFYLEVEDIMISKTLYDIPLGGHIIKEVGKITIEHPQIDNVDIGMYATRGGMPIKVYGKLEDGSDFCLSILAISTQLDTHEVYDKSNVFYFGDQRMY